MAFTTYWCFYSSFIQRARVTVVDQSGCAPQPKNESQAYQTHNHAQLEDGARKKREPEPVDP